MRITCFLFCFLLAAVAAETAEPGRVPVLAELFTSEGCSSCPPADALLMKLDQLQPVPGAQIIVLSEHVDYWNSLGWKDPYSSALFSARQNTYARLLGAEVYTPQIVIDGRDQFVGSDAAKIRDSIQRAASRPKTGVRIEEAKREGGDASVRLSIAALAKGKTDVWVAVADESARSSVSKGENSGRTLDHVAVVRSLTKVATVSKSEGLEKTVRVPAGASPSRVVVFLGDAGGPVYGAAIAKLE